ncbi:IpaB/EvcA family protein [Lactiplantibacillus mudanjiangensis]|uniref:IpaB/EvcA family protein [Lactobacillus sp.] n=1 Tax=Lactiplantibacillus mudanjiangensis TaxID=1296538 RepID=A0A660E7N3_9LACO|nr:IpaB/EvcA family protein [Lactiplantibacillus mudanjiangensis]VDG21400.1 IpaB/EvcA family protein [Lactobacillus sp.] [Lactiplantibacillus mudanjiangensis]VDG26082.1 IpaB/EvcA family protein [Lactobacillus sp.] [Lactiplantibacillus mudanjiangensis]VDG29080.1 IpaB/EvcA family protein [Lactobacillus sp.] [Lactiplantibacillus mudanjiangensis]VDG31597.1 IpaB/EvcA family protein [Lactobacillus sp.] [Lactiplantibacillus mudanjiangensis]
MTEPKLNQQVTDLLAATNSLFPGNVTVTLGDQKSGYVRHDQATQLMQNGDIEVHVSDVTAPSYTASHEVMHLLLLLQGFPQMTFNLTTNNEKLDEQLMAIATELYDAVAHVLIVKNQRDHDLIDADIEDLYFKGLYATIDPEDPNQDDAMMTLRLLTLTDLLVFFGGELTKDRLAKVTADFPKSWTAAQKLYEIIAAKPIETPFAMRRTVVKLFKAFDDQMLAWDLPLLHGSEFVTMQSVLSDRQQRLEVRQLFDIYHSEMIETEQQTRAFIGLNKNDRQNAFVLPAPAEKDSDDFFKELYGMNVKDLFARLNMPFTIR